MVVRAGSGVRVAGSIDTGLVRRGLDAAGTVTGAAAGGAKGRFVEDAKPGSATGEASLRTRARWATDVPSLNWGDKAAEPNTG